MAHARLRAPALRPHAPLQRSRDCSRSAPPAAAACAARCPPALRSALPRRAACRAPRATPPRAAAAAAGNAAPNDDDDGDEDAAPPAVATALPAANVKAINSVQNAYVKHAVKLRTRHAAAARAAPCGSRRRSVR
jgi:hypothetical protein